MNKPWYASEIFWGSFGAVGLGFGGAYWAFQNGDTATITTAIGAGISGLVAIVGFLKK